jgi:plastocyanin
MEVARIDALAVIGQSRRENPRQEPGRSIRNAAGGLPGERSKRKEEGPMTNNLLKLGLVICCFLFAGWTSEDDAPATAQVVALDECDPATFNAAVGPGFCRNVALGASTTFSALFAKAAAGTPDPNWDFEPDALTIKQGTTIHAFDQGGEPHTFTEVAKFGGGFIPALNAPGEEVVPECAGGFSRVVVARTRILQGSQLQVTGLSKGEHHFQCCIHPWMRTTVVVK